MVAISRLREERQRMEMPRYFPVMGKGSSLAYELTRGESSASVYSPKHVVIVMDGLKDFSVEPLEWVLRNITFEACCGITLLGVTPWLNIPSSKSRSDVWTTDLEYLLAMKDKIEWKTEAKYQKVQRLVDLCQKYGVVPRLRPEMGYPLQLLVAEQITSLHPTLVVFDRHHRKYRGYYAQKIPCSMVMMNDDGEADMIKTRSSLVDNGESNPGESPMSMPLTPTLMISQEWQQFLAQRPQQN